MLRKNEEEQIADKQATNDVEYCQARIPERLAELRPQLINQIVPMALHIQINILLIAPSYALFHLGLL